METALTYIYQIFDKVIDTLFNDMEITENVTIGWIAIAVIVFGILVCSILAVPSGIRFNYRNYNYFKQKEGK